MKIISKFKDFYDSVSHQYLDKEIVYLRDCRILEIERKNAPEVEEFDLKNLDQTLTHHFSLEIIGFCGKLYPVVTVNPFFTGYDPMKFSKSTTGFYEMSDFKSYLQANRIPMSEGSKYRWAWSFSFRETIKEIERFFESTKDFNKIENVFRISNTPCFTLRADRISRKRELIINPLLKNYQFFKVKNPYDAHQELSQFVSSYLKKPEREPLPISDKHKIAKHGFDEWSFRKSPKKPKGKK